MRTSGRWGSPHSVRRLWPLFAPLLAGCIDGLRPSADLGAHVRMSIASTPALDAAGTAVVVPQAVEIRVGYRTAGPFTELARRSVVPDSAGQTVTMPVNIAGCLTQAVTTCPLEVQVRLRDAAGAVYDSSTVGPLTAAVGATVTVPTIRFRATARLAALDSAVVVPVARTQLVRVQALDSEGQVLIGRALTWRSANPSIATVDASGLVSGVTPGRTTIEVTRESRTASVAVIVPVVEQLVLSAATTRVIATVPVVLNTTIVVAPGRTSAVLYRSGNPSVATVDGSGRVTTLREGTSVITVLAVADTAVRTSVTITVDPFRAVTAWQRFESGDRRPILDNADGIWGSSSSNVVLVGCNWVSRFDGTRWQFERNLPFCPRAVTGTSAQSIWALGNEIWRFDGATWAKEAATYSGVVWGAGAGRGAVFAVGDSGLILRRTATGWSSMPSPNRQRLIQVSVFDSTTAFAIGDGATLLRLQGNSWSAVPSLGNGDYTAVVTLSPTLAYVATFDPATFQSTIFQWNGTNWSRMPGDVIRRVRTLFVAGGDVFGTGDDGFIARLVLGRWEQDTPLAGGTSFTVGWGDADASVVAGLWGVSYVRRAGRWSLINSSVSYLSLWAFSSNFVVGGGNRGVLEIFDGTRWTVSRAPDLDDVKAIWGTDPQNIWAVGNLGNVLRYSGSAWERVDVGTTTNLWDVWGVARDTVWMVADDGRIRRFNGGQWLTVAATPSSLRAVHGSGSSNVFAVGSNGRIWRFDGATWLEEQSPTTATLLDVWVADSANAFAISSTQLLRRTNGSWRVVGTIQVTTASSGLRWVVGSGPNDVYTSGCGYVPSDNMHRYDGTVLQEYALNGYLECSLSAVLLPSGGMIVGGPYRRMYSGTGPLGNSPGIPR